MAFIIQSCPETRDLIGSSVATLQLPEALLLLLGLHSAAEGRDLSAGPPSDRRCRYAKFSKILEQNFSKISLKS